MKKVNKALALSVLCVLQHPAKSRTPCYCTQTNNSPILYPFPSYGTSFLGLFYPYCSTSFLVIRTPVRILCQLVSSPSYCHPRVVDLGPSWHSGTDVTSITMRHASSYSSPSDKGSSCAPGHFKHFKVITACYQVLVAFGTSVCVGGPFMVFNFNSLRTWGLRGSDVVSPLCIRLQRSCTAFMEQWGNNADRGKLKYWEKNIIQCGW